MNIQIQISEMPIARSLKGAREYFESHLQNIKEAGRLGDLEEYLDRDGRVVPLFGNPDVWRLVGQDSTSDQPNMTLVINLCRGVDLAGTRLTKTVKKRIPHEILITFPSEVSEALRNDPAAAFNSLIAAAVSVLESLDQLAVRVRRDGIRTYDPGSTLMVCYAHALNKSGEPHLHLHLVVFPPTLYRNQEWRTFENRAFLKALHSPGGGRDLATKAMIEEADYYGYRIQLNPGKASGPGQNGATVTCPDGRVIESGTVFRVRGAELLSHREVTRKLGVPALTRRELDIVITNIGRKPKEILGLRNHKVFSRKLDVLGLLDGQGQIEIDLKAALNRMDFAMAVVQVSLRDLPFLEGVPASEMIQEHRAFLRDRFPEIQTEEQAVKVLWIERYESTLEQLHEVAGGIAFHSVQDDCQKMLLMLERAGIVKREWVKGNATFRLTPMGEERRIKGLREQQGVERSVEELYSLISEGAPSAGVIRGRFALAGVIVRDNQLLFHRLGRIVGASELILQAGITADTPVVFDHEWWAGYWDRRFDLSEVLIQSVLVPEVLPPRRNESPRTHKDKKQIPPPPQPQMGNANYVDEDWKKRSTIPNSKITLGRDRSISATPNQKEQYRGRTR